VKRVLVGVILLAAFVAWATFTFRTPDLSRVEVGNPAPPFAAVTLAGDTVSLESLRGSPVLLNLWATWCAPCRRETPFLQTVHERYGGQGVQVVGVTTDSRAAVPDVQAFLDEFGVTYRILHDPDARSMDVFSAIGLPATYLIARDGTVLWMRLGEVREGDPDFEAALVRAVGAEDERHR
jgi:peroxiredoxin